MEIRYAVTEQDLNQVRRLFAEYFEWIRAEHGIDLGYQGTAAELASLPGVYAEPAGCILLAESDGDTLSLSDGETLVEGDTLADPLRLGESDGDTLAEGDTLADADREGDSDADRLGLDDGEADATALQVAAASR